MTKARELASKHPNRENEVADASAEVSGRWRCVRVKKRGQTVDWNSSCAHGFGLVAVAVLA
jgi:hypothetical protein